MASRKRVLCAACGNPARLNPRGEPDILQDGEPLCQPCALEGYTAVHAKIVARDHVKHLAHVAASKATRTARRQRRAAREAAKGGRDRG